MPLHRPDPGPSYGHLLGVLASLGLSALPLAAQAELRPAVLPEEICLVLSNGPFDADVAALIARRDDFAAILLQAETDCPELAPGLVGATATIPTGVTDNDTGGPDQLPPTGGTPPIEQPAPPPVENPQPEEPPPPPPPVEEPPPDTNPEEPPPDFPGETNPLPDPPIGSEDLNAA